MIDEISQSQKGRQCDSTYIRYLEWSKAQRQSSMAVTRDRGAGWGQERDQSYCLTDIVSILHDEKSSGDRWMVMPAQYYECI